MKKFANLCFEFSFDQVSPHFRHTAGIHWKHLFCFVLLPLSNGNYRKSLWVSLQQESSSSSSEVKNQKLLFTLVRTDSSCLRTPVSRCISRVSVLFLLFVNHICKCFFICAHDTSTWAEISWIHNSRILIEDIWTAQYLSLIILNQVIQT